MTDLSHFLVQLFALALLACLYFTPSMIAVHRKHHQVTPIFLLNLCLGWTLLVWFLALPWAVSAIRQDVVE